MQASLLDILNSESFRQIIIQQEKLAKSLQPTLDTLRIQSAALSKALQPSIDAFQWETIQHETGRDSRDLEEFKSFRQKIMHPYRGPRAA